MLRIKCGLVRVILTEEPRFLARLRRNPAGHLTDHTGLFGPVSARGWKLQLVVPTLQMQE